MEEFRSTFHSKEDSSFPSEMSKSDSPLLDMEGFETLDTSPNVTSGYGGIYSDLISDNNTLDDLVGNLQSGLISTTRPLVTSSEDEGISSASNLNDYVNVQSSSSLIDISGADTRVEDTFRDPVPERQQRSGNGDHLLIHNKEQGRELRSFETIRFVSAGNKEEFSHLPLNKLEESSEAQALLPKIKDTKIDTEAEEDNYESGIRAYQTAAQPVKTEVAMEAEKVGNATEINDCDCPFSPGAWFNPDKLHPVVAKYVYWKDPKQSGIALGASLVLLLSFKYFSVISVAAYLTVALLSITVSFRIYKNVVQAVQKSNDGHPFKEYLEMDITLSQGKVGQTVETLIHHVNCVSGKLRSLILVEDLVDTIKLGILAWCMTYIGAWFNGLTLVILAVVSAFTLPKVYETNKAQIDVYAELVRTKGKDVIELVNAKMPLGKKKKEQ